MRRSADLPRRLALAAALLLAAPAIAGEPASAVHGDWFTEGARAIVRVAPCGERLCGTVVWLWQSRDEAGQPMADRANPDAERRGRPLVGVDLLSGFRPTAAGQWSDGTIYNPEDGRSYKANLRLDSAEEMTVEGCVLIICKKQLWRRAASVCTGR